MSNNTAYIYQPHFMTSKFRVATCEQNGTDSNYVVVTCSPAYNGVWKWDANKKGELSIWMNGKLPCYEVPISICSKIKTLEEVTNKEVKKKIIEQQNKWWNNEVKNRNYDYKEKPEWILKGDN